MVQLYRVPENTCSFGFGTLGMKLLCTGEFFSMSWLVVTKLD